MSCRETRREYKESILGDLKPSRKMVWFVPQETGSHGSDAKTNYLSAPGICKYSAFIHAGNKVIAVVLTRKK